ncbi:hypothetical protein A6302_03069 [Methylobrevis pamukkalensis]|uniref:Uncharacterized protein n=1 Tax=Methylobrevis pamukkalensis TaxID=1439726 RepID=A0A1E3GZZ9_9HYPH|nr:hypothetical protein A6302_03069 [Methylobrevis pamukkalensis]
MADPVIQLVDPAAPGRRRRRLSVGGTAPRSAIAVPIPSAPGRLAAGDDRPEEALPS